MGEIELCRIGFYAILDHPNHFDPIVFKSSNITTIYCANLLWWTNRDWDVGPSKLGAMPRWVGLCAENWFVIYS